MIRKFTLTTVLAIMIASTAMAETTPVVLTPSDPDSDSLPEVKENGYGRRTPPRRVMCYVDIEARTITSDSDKVNGADTFEIWDADGQACLQEFGSKEEFLDALAASSGQAVVIKLRGDGYSLKGYITL